MVWRADAFVPLPRDEVPPPEPGSPFGRIYFNANIDKNHAVGKASYHFQTPDKCFISYDTAPDEWKFDDGSLIREVPILRLSRRRLTLPRAPSRASSFFRSRPSMVSSVGSSRSSSLRTLLRQLVAP